MNKYAEMVPVDQCKDHDYVFIKRESILATEGYMLVIPKDIYACIHCGLAMEVYDLVNKVDINRNA